jgi:hypothetical protein
MPTDNGILAWVPGEFQAKAARLLPAAIDLAQPGLERKVVIDVPKVGWVEVTFILNTYRHGKSRHWHWVAKRAEHAARDRVS